MKHAARTLAGIVIAFAIAGCADGGPTGAASPTAFASAPVAPGSPASSTTPSGVADSPAPSSTPVATTPKPATAPSPVTVAEADGWRLVITRPESGATVDRSATICYQASGTTRESSVAFDVSVVPLGSTSTGVPTRLPGTIGAGSIEVDLSAVSPGRFDLRIGLVGDDQVIAGVVVTIPGLVVGDAATDGCP